MTIYDSLEWECHDDNLLITVQEYLEVMTCLNVIVLRIAESRSLIKFPEKLRSKI